MSSTDGKTNQDTRPFLVRWNETQSACLAKTMDVLKKHLANATEYVIEQNIVNDAIEIRVPDFYNINSLLDIQEISNFTRKIINTYDFGAFTVYNKQKIKLQYQLIVNYLGESNPSPAIIKFVTDYLNQILMENIIF